MSSISSPAGSPARRRTFEPAPRGGGAKRRPSKASSVPVSGSSSRRTRVDGSRDPRRGRSRPALYAMCRVGPSRGFFASAGDSFTDYARIGGLTGCIHTQLWHQRNSVLPRRIDRRPLLDRDLPVLARAHREPLEPVLGGELGEAGEMGPRGLRVLAERRHRHQPDDPHRAALDERRRARSAAMPPLPSSPATLTSTRTSVSGVAVAWRAASSAAVGGDRVDQAHERQQIR